MVSYRKAVMLKVIFPVLLSGSVAKDTKGKFLKQKKKTFSEKVQVFLLWLQLPMRKKKKGNECTRELKLDLRKTLKKG